MSKILSEETLQAIERGDSIALIWTIHDVLLMSEDEEGNETITEDAAREILQQLYEDHNANYGISWDTIYQAVSHYKRQGGVDA
jgi:hypothetical protein